MISLNPQRLVHVVYKVTIKGEFPSLNEFIFANRSNPYVGNKMKKESQYLISMFIKLQLKGIHIKEPIHIEYRFYCKNRKRDLDNISGYFHKVFQDALVNCNVIDNDGWNNITGFTDLFFIDKSNPRIEVFLST